MDTHLFLPLALHSTSYNMHCTGMGQVFTSAHGGVVEYSANQNVTPVYSVHKYTILQP